MIAVLFEADAIPEYQTRYLQLAGELRSELENVQGFISIERFYSLNTEGKILSLSWWENEDAVLAWKKNVRHQAAQKEGQQIIFAHYRISILNALRAYSYNKKDDKNV